MTRRRRIALFDRRDRRGDESFEQPLDRFVQQVVFDGDRRLTRQRTHDLDRFLIERDDFARHGLRRQLRRRADFLPIDELQHADDVADVIRHRKDEQRTRQVVVLRIERCVDRVFGVGRKAVGVVDDERLRGHRHISRKALAGDRQNFFFERSDVDRVALGELPAKHTLSVDFVEQIQRSGVGARQLARFAEDHRQEHLMIAHRRQRDADFAHLFQLARPLAQLPFELIGAHLLIEKLIRALHRVEQHGGRRITRQMKVNAVRLFIESDSDNRRARIECRNGSASVRDRRIDEDHAQC